MTDLWWLRPEWKEAICAQCGTKIWPEGDPDWGLCYACFTEHLNRRDQTEGAAKVRGGQADFAPHE